MYEVYETFALPDTQIVGDVYFTSNNRNSSSHTVVLGMAIVGMVVVGRE